MTIPSFISSGTWIPDLLQAQDHKSSRHTMRYTAQQWRMPMTTVLNAMLWPLSTYIILTYFTRVRLTVRTDPLQRSYRKKSTIADTLNAISGVPFYTGCLREPLCPCPSIGQDGRCGIISYALLESAIRPDIHITPLITTHGSDRLAILPTHVGVRHVIPPKDARLICYSHASLNLLPTGPATQKPPPLWMHVNR